MKRLRPRNFPKTRQIICGLRNDNELEIKASECPLQTMMLAWKEKMKVNTHDGGGSVLDRHSSRWYRQ